MTFYALPSSGPGICLVFTSKVIQTGRFFIQNFYVNHPISCSEFHKFPPDQSSLIVLVFLDLSENGVTNIACVKKLKIFWENPYSMNRTYVRKKHCFLAQNSFACWWWFIFKLALVLSPDRIHDLRLPSDQNQRRKYHRESCLRIPEM